MPCVWPICGRVATRRMYVTASRVSCAIQLASALRKINVLNHARLGSIGTTVAMSVRNNTVLVMKTDVLKYVKLVVSAIKAVFVMKVASVSYVVKRIRA